MQNTVPQIEYGDFYKFVVSLGIALVRAAILVLGCFCASLSTSWLKRRDWVN
jgi:hypothetical protein